MRQLHSCWQVKSNRHSSSVILQQQAERLRGFCSGQHFCLVGVSPQIIREDSNKFFWRQRSGIRVSGNITEVFAVILSPVCIQDSPYAMLDGIGRYMIMFGGILIQGFAGQKRAVRIRGSMMDDVDQKGISTVGRIDANPD